jgi:hypothetical protein
MAYQESLSRDGPDLFTLQLEMIMNHGDVEKVQSSKDEQEREE